MALSQSSLGVRVLAGRRDPGAGAWREAARDAPPFLQPEFFGLLAREIEGRPRVYIAERGGRAVGALPLMQVGRTLEALRSAHTPRYDFVGDAASLQAIFDAVMRTPGWDVLVFKNVPSGSLLSTDLPTIARRRFCYVETRPGQRSPYFALGGEGGFEGRMDGKFRTNLRRCFRKIGEPRFERITRFSPADYAEGLRLEAMAWKGEAGTALNVVPKVKRMYEGWLRLFGRRGQCSLNFLTVGERRVAFLYAFEDAHSFYAVKPGYDTEFYNVSPGHLILRACALDAEARGLKEFDFLGRDDDWKYKWTPATRSHVHVVVYRASLRGWGRMAYRALKARLGAPMEDGE
jgi:CelD/BcsL family acetyltransferase involved in cellulose biosynthesis